MRREIFKNQEDPRRYEQQEWMLSKSDNEKTREHLEEKVKEISQKVKQKAQRRESHNITSLSHLSLKPAEKWTREVDIRSNSSCCRMGGKKRQPWRMQLWSFNSTPELGRLTHPVPGCVPRPCREPLAGAQELIITHLLHMLADAQWEGTQTHKPCSFL